MWLKRMFKNKKPDHVVLRTAPKRQKLSIKFVQNGISEGWLTLKDGSIQIKGFQEIKDPATGIRNKIQAPTYQIIKFPGVFCCFCDEMLPAGDAIARNHVEEKHSGLDSPDVSNKSGYRYKNFYECEKEE